MSLLAADSSFVKTTFVGAADARGRTKDELAVGGRGVLEAIASRVLVTIEAELGGEMSVLSGKGVCAGSRRASPKRSKFAVSSVGR